MSEASETVAAEPPPGNAPGIPVVPSGLASETAARRPVKRIGFSPWLFDRREELLFLNFLWISSLAVYTLGTADSSNTAAGARCLISGLTLMLLSLAGFIVLPAASRLRVVPFALLLASISIPPVILTPSNRAGLAMLDLYLISFVALPVFLRLITPGASIIVSIVAGAIAYVCGSKMPGGVDIFAIAIVPVAGAVAVVAAGTNAVRSFRQRAVDGYATLLDRLAEQPTLFSSRFWLTAMFYLSLLLVLLFFNLVIVSRPLSESAPTIYAIVAFLVGCFLLSSIGQRYFAIGALLLLFAGTITISILTYPGQVGFFHPVMPIVAALLSTTLLPWTIGLEVVLVFCSLAGTIVVMISQAPGAALTFSATGAGLIQYRPDITSILLCGTFSVLVSRIIHQRSAGSAVAGLLGSAGFDGTNSPARREQIRRGEVSGICHLPLPSRIAVSEVRSSAMVSNVLLLVILSNLVVTLMTVRQSGIPSGVAAGAWVAGILAWSGLYVVNQRYREKEPIWFFAGFVTIALLSLPSILLAWHPEGFDLWFLWLLCIFVGIGLSPWRLVELVPISIAVLIIGLVVAEELQDPPHGELVYAITLLLAILASIQTSRRAKIGAILGQIERSLASATDAPQVVTAIADNLAELFEAPFVLVRTDEQQLQVVSSGTILPLSPIRWPLSQLIDRVSQSTADQGFRPEFVRGLPPIWDFFDPACGLISVRGGILFRLPPRPGATAAEINGSPGIQSSRCPAILVPVPILLPPIWWRAELTVAEAIAGLGRLRSDGIRETGLRVEAAELMERSHTERELELGILVHDINNTVQDLTVLCDLLIEDSNEGSSTALSIGSGAESTVRRIAEIARSMAAVVSDAKRKRELEMLSDLRPRETVDVGEVLLEILSFARIRGERKRIAVLGPEAFDEPVFVRVSAREHLETILRNLLNNAMSYSDPGSVIKVTVEFDAELVRIRVIDNGRGLTTEECDAIFGSGFRGHSSRGVTGGLGIGLAQSRRVAESAGGRLIAESPGVNFGSTFLVELPRSAELPAAIPQRSWALVVDDQPALVDFYRRIATALNIPPISAASFPEARDILAENGRPSFVLTDIHLGNSSGLDLVRHIREQFGPGVPILVISGLTGEGIDQQARSAGADDFVAKPVGRRALYARIQSLLALN